MAEADSTPSPLYPLVPPDPVAGEAVFLENCVPCHGETGLGDGPRARDLPNPVPAIGSFEIARGASPVGWFNLVTDGNLQRSMPPFPNLTNRQKWDVVAYAIRLSVKQGNLSTGKQVYENQCQACHGVNGSGDGELVAGSHLPDFTSQETMASKSAREFFTSISAGISPGMPSFADKLSESERWAVASYIRSFSFAKAVTEETGGTPYPVAPYPPLETPNPFSEDTGMTGSSTAYPDATAELTLTGPLSTKTDVSPGIVTVTGHLTNESGGPLPVGQDVTLHVFDDMQLVYTTTTPIEENGAFTFGQVVVTPNRSLFATVDFESVTYGSEIKTANAGQTTIELPLHVYNTTTDLSVLTAERVHYFVDLADQNSMKIVELFIISNNSSKTLIASAPDQPVVKYILPSRAFNLKFRDGRLGGKYIKTEDGFGDLTPIRPGSSIYQLLFSYQMPYDRELGLISQLPMDAKAMVVLVPEPDLKLKSAHLQDDGIREVEGVSYHMYSGSSLKKGQELNLTITRRTSLTSGGLALFSDTGFVIGLGVLGIVLIAAGVWLFKRSQPGRISVSAESKFITQDYDSSETVMDAILALDDLYQEGQLPEEAYLQRRGELKSLLREFMNSNG